MKTADTLRLLWSAVEANREALSAPFAPGETSRPVTTPTHFFTDEHWKAVQVVVDAVRRDAPSIYNRFAGSVSVGNAIVTRIDDEDTKPTLQRVIEMLDQDSDPDQRWLIGTPLANLKVPNRLVPLGDGAALIPTEPDREWTSVSESAVPEGIALRPHLGDWISPRPQWLQATDRRVALDTRQMASLVTIEQGTRYAARDVARARAGYAIGVWTLEQQDSGRGYQWPTEGIWGPQPHLDLGQTDKPFEPDKFTGRTSQSGRTIEHGAWELPDGNEVLRLPFDAIARAERSPAARAVLASSRSLYLAARFPSDLMLSERYLHLYTAIATLCEGDDRSTKTMLRRWERLWSSLGLRHELTEAGYKECQLRKAETLLKHVRDMAGHAADSALVNLGYPAERARRFANKEEIPGERLSRAMLVSDLRPLLYMSRTAVRTVLHRLAEADWDETAFDGLFA